MSKKNRSKANQEWMIPLSDLTGVFRRNKNTLFWCSLILGTVFFLYAASFPIQYSAQATFRDKGTKDAGMQSSAVMAIFGAVSEKNSGEATSLLESGRVLQPVVQKFGLQVHSKDFPKPSLLRRITDNLRTQAGILLRKKIIPITEQESPLSFKNVRYTGEVPLDLRLVVQNEREYDLYQGDRLLGQGEFGRRLTSEPISLVVLLRTPQEPHTSFSLNVLPTQLVLQELKGKLTVFRDKKEATVLELTFKETSRKKAELILNGIMSSYRHFLEREQEEYASSQLSYLEKRKKENFDELKNLMAVRADELAENIETSGLFDSEKVLEFFLTSQIQSLDRIQQLDLEMNRLSTLLSQKKFDGSGWKEGGMGPAHQEIVKELHQLKQHRDSLFLALQEYNLDHEPGQLIDPIAIESLMEHAKLRGKEIAALQYAVHNGQPIKKDLGVVQDPTLSISTWVRRLEQAQSSEDVAELEERFLVYLSNIENALNVHEKIAEERLNYQYQPQTEFQGLDYRTASAIYDKYTAEYSEIEREIRQNRFILKQLDDPDFEVNSLSTILKDPVSQQIIQKAMEFTLNARDEGNRSARELERIQQGLETQKKFLSGHLSQTNDLLDLRLGLMGEKIHSLQGTLMELANQRISLLQKRLEEQMNQQLLTLVQEKEIIDDQLSKLNKKMAGMPHEWMDEQLIKHNLQVHRAIMEEITKLVEGKNINHNLEVIQSSPLDMASAPLRPNNPHLILFGFIGVFIGACVVVGITFSQALRRGLPATPDNIQVSGGHVSGIISRFCATEELDQMSDQDLDALRQTLSVLDSTALLLLGNGPDYSQAIATLATKRGEKVLLISERNQSDSFIDGATETPQIDQNQPYDQIHLGRQRRYSAEALISKRMRQFISKQQDSYDRILIAIHERLDSGSGESLLRHYPVAAVTLTNETIPQIDPYLHSEDVQLTFLFLQS